MPRPEEHCQSCRRLADTYSTPTGRLCDQCIRAHDLIGRCQWCGRVLLSHRMSRVMPELCNECHGRHYTDLIIVGESSLSPAKQAAIEKRHSYWIGPSPASLSLDRALELVQERSPARIITDDPIMVAIGFYTRTPVVVIRNGQAIEAGISIGPSDIGLWIGKQQYVHWTC